MNTEDHLEYNRHHGKRIAYLVAGHLEQSLTPAEAAELDNWINASDQNLRLFEELTDLDKLKQGFNALDELDQGDAMEKIQSRLHVQEKRRRLPWRLAAAASITLIAAFSLYFLLSRENKPVKAPLVAASTDIAPGSSKAMLQLANGTRIQLDHTSTGSIRENIRKDKADEIIYQTAGGEMQGSNTLSTPAGGQYRVVLADGTRVWLNAASTLQYPVGFAGDQRRVVLTGEAYFEVTKDAARPFVVQTPHQQVEVLGTHFNINAYNDESIETTSLLEGAVRIKTMSPGNPVVILKPGQQAQLPETGKMQVARDIDPGEVLAWKNGKFEFHDQTIDHIMRQLARWYNAEIEYQGSISYHFNATIDRDVPVSRILQLLEMTNRVHFTVSGNKIIVKP